MEMGKHIAVREMKSIALEYLGFEDEYMKNLADDNRAKELFNFDILLNWRNKSTDNTKMVTFSLFSFLDILEDISLFVGN